MAIPRELAFEIAEYESRLECARHNMRTRGMDGLILFGPHNINYLSGLHNQNVADLQCLIVPLDGPLTLILPFFEAGRAENSSWVDDVVTYRSHGDLVEAIRSALNRAGLKGETLGLEQRATTLSAHEYAYISRALGEAKVEDPFGVVEQCRKVKSPAEIAYIRRAAAMTDGTVAAACEAIAEGVRDTEVGAATLSALYESGSDPVFQVPFIASGFLAGAPHSTFNGRNLRYGDTVFLELTAAVKRYVAPVMHTVVLGDPTPQMERMSNAGAATLEAIIRCAKPGVAARDVAREALGVLEPVLRDEGIFFHYNFGYPVGIEYPPTWIEALDYLIMLDNPQPLEAGMVFHLPISLRRFGEFGVNQSHTILITEFGAEPLTQTPMGLQVVAA